MHELSTSAQAFLRSNQKPIISGKFGNKSGDNSPSYPRFILNFLNKTTLTKINEPFKP